jgi:hypothetical protein
VWIVGYWTFIIAARQAWHTLPPPTALEPSARRLLLYLSLKRTAAQAESLPESSRGSSAATPPDRGPEFLPDLGGVAELWHPSRMPGSAQPLPGVFAPLRPPATLCQPCGLVILDKRRSTDERQNSLAQGRRRRRKTEWRCPSEWPRQSQPQR